jgi:hypothetical protein
MKFLKEVCQEGLERRLVSFANFIILDSIVRTASSESTLTWIVLLRILSVYFLFGLMSSRRV